MLRIILLSFVSLFLTTACATTVKQDYCAAHLASPIENFCEVIPNTLWRGAKPTKESTKWLIQIGVKTIINLELIHDDADILKEIPLAKSVDYYRVPTWEPFYAVAHDKADEDVIRFLTIAKYAKPPMYVHCRAGENRTGVMIAAYKIILQNQHSPEQVAAVIKEMQSYDGFWSDATTDYIQNLAGRYNEIKQKVERAAIIQPTRF